jgi:hypothetical protein
MAGGGSGDRVEGPPSSGAHGGRALTPVRRGVFIIVTLVLLVAVPLLGLEALLRLLDRARPVVSGWRAPQAQALPAEHNQLGFRGVPIEYADDDFVVLLVGDSQVQAEACSYFWLPERRLEYHLSGKKRARVFSIGAYGWGQDQQLLAMREYYKTFRADLVIVWLTPGNDLWNNTFPTGDIEGRQPKPTYWLESGTLRGPTSLIGEVVSPPLRLLTAYERAFVSWDQNWERRLPTAYVPLTSYTGPVKQTWQVMWDRKQGNISRDNMASEKSHQTIYLTPRSPRTQYSIDLTHRLLEEMSREATAHDGRFMTFRVDPPNAEVDIGKDEEAVFVLNGRYYRVSNRQKSATIADINRGFDSYELSVPTYEWRVSPSDGHLNEHAVDEVMQQLANVVLGLIAAHD